MHRLLLLAAVLLLSLGPAEGAPADVVLRNGAVYTVDPEHPWAQAVAVAGGRLVFVGRNADVAPFIGPRTRVVDLNGRMVLPGLHDSHIHLVEGGLEQGRCNLSDCETPAEVRARISDYARAHPKVPWIIGTGWDVALYPQGNPSRQELDRLVPDRPACLQSSDGHSLWVNTLALKRAGIDARTPDPPRGRIERDARGFPSGTLREDAVHLVDRLLPSPSREEGLRALLMAQRMAHRFGITSIQDAHATPDVLAAYRLADARGQLALRVVAALHSDAERDESQVEAMVRERARASSPLLRVSAVKIFLDGVIETHTGAMLEPYADRPKERGILNFEPAALTRLVTRLDRDGFQVHIHAIGDRAVRESLNSFAAARQVNGARDSRHHMAHLQMIDAADIPRFAELGVGANFQPFWMQNDDDAVRLDRPALGPARFAAQYPIAAVARSGGTVVGGSDWTVTTMNPFDAIEVAVTHRPLGDRRSTPYVPDQRIDLALALAAYTRNGAWVGFQEKETGSLEVGKAADLIVLDRNLFRIDSSQIHRARVLLTMLAGRVVHRAGGLWKGASRPSRAGQRWAPHSSLRFSGFVSRRNMNENSVFSA